MYNSTNVLTQRLVAELSKLIVVGVLVIVLTANSGVYRV